VWCNTGTHPSATGDDETPDSSSTHSAPGISFHHLWPLHSEERRMQMKSTLKKLVLILVLINFCCRYVSSLTLNIPSSSHRNPTAMSASSAPNEICQFKVLGVCGGIGSGKSSACKLLVSDLACLAHLGMYTYSDSKYTDARSADRRSSRYDSILAFIFNIRCGFDRAHRLQSRKSGRS
jgi:hypothetical protein